MGRAFKGQAVARANSKDIAIHKGLRTSFRVSGEELGILEDAILMVQVAMHNVSLTVLSDRRGRRLIRIRENPEESGEKQRGSEHQAKNAVW